MFDDEILIRTSSTTLLQLFYEVMLDFKLNPKSVRDPGDTGTNISISGMN